MAIHKTAIKKKRADNINASDKKQAEGSNIAEKKLIYEQKNKKQPVNNTGIAPGEHPDIAPGTDVDAGTG